MKTILTAILIAVLLSGCGTLQQQPPVERIVYKFISVPAEMTKGVISSPPPEPVAYSTLSTDQQESLLMSLIRDHHQSINVCNSRLYGIQEWSNKQLKIYELVNP